ncbi:MAG: hypothetical protein A2Y24_03435 [Clostridiales bacterium GWE2_32_10]|nr:MAG: hypothetical protein A2Y24_03435 [Clostridiales bacterium GWE2_32_10]HBY21054.1 hypothetical protein [Clostridiales bacterium]
MLNYNFDKNDDILYVTIGYPIPSYGEEDIEGIILRKSMQTHELAGITILDFRDRLKNHKEDLSSLPITLNLKEIENKILCA